MSHIKVLLLMALECSIAFTKIWQVRPLGNKDMVGLGDWSTDLLPMHSSDGLRSHHGNGVAL